MTSEYPQDGSSFFPMITVLTHDCKLCDVHCVLGVIGCVVNMSHKVRVPTRWWPWKRLMISMIIVNFTNIQPFENRHTVFVNGFDLVDFFPCELL